MGHVLRALALALFILTGLQAARLPGAVVFVKVVSEADDARSNVYVQPLAAGGPRLLVAHTSLPSTFRGRIERALPSADGTLIALQESRGFVIRSAATGSTRVVLGSGYSTVGDEAMAEEFGGGLWLWSRTSGKTRKLTMAPTGWASEPIGWSPGRATLLVQVTDPGTGRSALKAFDASTGKTRHIRTVHGLGLARWTADGASVLVGEQPEGRTTTLTMVPLRGKARRVLTTRGVYSAAASRDGRRIAIGGTLGFYLCDGHVRAQRRLKLPTPEGFPGAEMAFSSDGRRLAVLTSSTGSGAFANVNEALWIVDTATAKVRRLRQWEVTLGNSPGEDFTHRLLGWTQDRSSLLVMTRSCTIQGVETEWRKLWLQPADPAQPDRLLAGTGARGIDMSWYGVPGMPF